MENVSKTNLGVTHLTVKPIYDLIVSQFTRAEVRKAVERKLRNAQIKELVEGIENYKAEIETYKRNTLDRMVANVPDVLQNCFKELELTSECKKVMEQAELLIQLGTFQKRKYHQQMFKILSNNFNFFAVFIEAQHAIDRHLSYKEAIKCARNLAHYYGARVYPNSLSYDLAMIQHHLKEGKAKFDLILSEFEKGNSEVSFNQADMHKLAESITWWIHFERDMVQNTIAWCGDECKAKPREIQTNDTELKECVANYPVLYRLIGKQ